MTATSIKDNANTFVKWLKAPAFHIKDIAINRLTAIGAAMTITLSAIAGGCSCRAANPDTVAAAAPAQVEGPSGERIPGTFPDMQQGFVSGTATAEAKKTDVPPTRTQTPALKPTEATPATATPKPDATPTLVKVKIEAAKVTVNGEIDLDILEKYIKQEVGEVNVNTDDQTGKYRDTVIRTLAISTDPKYVIEKNDHVGPILAYLMDIIKTDPKWKDLKDAYGNNLPKTDKFIFLLGPNVSQNEALALSLGFKLTTVDGVPTIKIGQKGNTILMVFGLFDAKNGTVQASAKLSPFLYKDPLRNAFIFNGMSPNDGTMSLASVLGKGDNEADTYYEILRNRGIVIP